MHLSNLSIQEHGIVTIRHHFDFDALVREAAAAGVDAHPCVIARNWCPQRTSDVRNGSLFTAFSAAFTSRATIEDVRAALAAAGLRPCTPHEALSFAIGMRDRLVEGEHHVALGHVWHAPDGPAALNVWRCLGRPYVGTSPCEGTWNGEAGWKFLAAMAR